MTRVGLIYVPERINVYLRFGRPRLEQLVDAHRRWVEFADGAVFCRIRWERAEYGTTFWQLLILQASGPGKGSQRVDGVAPGANLLAKATGEAAVLALLRVIDAIENLRIDPTDVSPSYWRMLNNRRLARVDAADFGLDRHEGHRLLGAGK